MSGTTQNGKVEFVVDGHEMLIEANEQMLPTLQLVSAPAGTPVVSDEGTCVAYVTDGMMPWIYVAMLIGGRWSHELVCGGNKLPDGMYWDEESAWAPDLYILKDGYPTVFAFDGDHWEEATPDALFAAA
jgi:hypothetical protein